jgi:hypothetical protein
LDHHLIDADQGTENRGDQKSDDASEENRQAWNKEGQCSGERLLRLVVVDGSYTA